MTRTAGFKLLIADDYAPMRQTLRELLLPIASDILEATDGDQAVRLFAEQHPDCVVMDVQMKPVNGVAATRAIRSCFPTARVVIVTQYDDDGLRAEASAAGASAYILKDNLSALAQLIARETGSSRSVTKSNEPPGNP